MSAKDLSENIRIERWYGYRMLPKHLVTIKKASEITGSSTSFFKQLLREGKLNRYKINTATFVSLTEFENLAICSINHRPEQQQIQSWVKQRKKS